MNVRTLIYALRNVADDATVVIDNSILGDFYEVAGALAIDNYGEPVVVLTITDHPRA